MKTADGVKTLNLNLGILGADGERATQLCLCGTFADAQFTGHVDSGKTSLAKALSEQASTAAFDKNPQSQERGARRLVVFVSCVSVDAPAKASLWIWASLCSAFVAMRCRSVFAIWVMRSCRSRLWTGALIRLC